MSKTSEKANRAAWSSVYQDQPRREHPDLMLIHLLARYAFANHNIRRSTVIGCADGAEAFAVARRGSAVACVDFAEGAIERARRFADDEGLASQLSFHVADQRRIPDLADNSQDLVVSWSVISYLEQEEVSEALGEIARILKPGGAFVGLLESLESATYCVDGARQIGERTYFVPDVSASVKGCVMTFFAEKDVREALASDFELGALHHRIIETIEPSPRNVSQWLFYARRHK